MHNVLNFIIKYQAWFLFLLYIVASLFLLFNFNNFQKAIFLSSANEVSASIYRVHSGVTGYFGLKGINADLERQNGELQNEVFRLQEEIKSLKALASDSSFDYIPNSRYSFVIASVLNNDVRHKKNYFTIDKGIKDGLRPGMGVVNRSGIVGIIDICGKNTSRVISVLNEKQNFSVKLAGTDYVGTLLWKHGNQSIAYIDELPRHIHYRMGDTIMTSGFSTAFPAGIPVGTVINRVKGENDNFIQLKIKLFPSFGKLETVRVIRDYMKPEIDSLQTIQNSAESLNR